MSSRRRLLLWLVGSAGVIAPAFGAPGRTAASEQTAPTAIAWQSAGDSYSSGEGVFGNVGACAQSDLAYGPLAAQRLGWNLASKTFTACTGHFVEDYFTARSDALKSSLWEWGRQQGGPARVDVLTMSFGGNDIGFADVITQCLLLVPERWTDLATAGLVVPELSTLTGCDESKEALFARVDHLVDPDRACEGSRRTGAVDYTCALNIGTRFGSIVDFYYDVVTQRLTDRGRLYIVGYPRIFADVDQWPGWIKVSCQGVLRGDTEKLGQVAVHLNDKLREAVDRANEALGSKRVVFVDRLELYRSGQHELCGTSDDWVNGVTMDRGEGIGIRWQGSFHPNAAGHDATANALVSKVLETFPFPTSTSDALRSAPVPSLCGNRAGRLVDGTLPAEFLVGDSDAELEPFVQLFEPVEPVEADLDGDGRVEFAAVVLCSYPSMIYPNGYQSLVVWDAALNVLGYVERPTSAFESFRVDSRGAVIVRSVTCDPDIVVCQPVAQLDEQLIVVGNEVRLQRIDGPSAANCVSQELMYVGMPGPDPEVVLLQRTLLGLGYDPGEVDGYFGDRTLTATAQSQDAYSDGTSGGNGVFIDEGTVLSIVFERLGIACG